MSCALAFSLLSTALGGFLAGVVAPAPPPPMAAAAAAPLEPFALEAFRWRAEATPQALVRARNEWGDLRVRTAHRGGVMVGAMVQAVGAAGADLEVRITEGDEAVVVEVVPLVAAPRGRVDLTVLVPPGKRFEGVTRDGIAEIKYGGDVAVRTRGGAITLETAGRAEASSESGSIAARLSGWSEPPLAPGADERPLSFSSRGGDVTLWLPAAASLDLELAAGGAVEVGGFLRVDGGSEVPEGGTLRKLGEGGAVLRATSDRGDVKVLPLTGAAAPTTSPGE